MLFGLVTLSYFDVASVVSSCVIILLIQVINTAFGVRPPENKSTKSIKCPTGNGEVPTAETNGERVELRPESSTSSLSTSSSPASPSSSARNSLNSSSNGHIQRLPTQESFSDEYHEDEDTLSLENLFPCDQTEIYASKKISFIIDELIQTEANYVNNLRKGLANYGGVHDRRDAPETLRGVEKRSQLLGNIENVLALHEREILPMMLRNQRDLKMLFDEFASHFDKDNFYCYVIFTMTKKTSMQLRQEHREWFQQYQTEINDKLGIDSFLVQPIQRLTRYPLLLQQFISEFYKSGINCKPVLVSVCKLETRMRRMIEIVNQAEEIPTIEDIGQSNINLLETQFRRCSEFDAYNHRSRKKYRVKAFLFDHCLVCAEVRKKRLAFKHLYTWESLEMQLKNSKSLTLLVKSSSGSSSATAVKPGYREECDFTASEASTLKEWMRCARKIHEIRRTEAELRGKVSLPMDLVMGVAVVIWLIWHYLY